MNLATPAVLLGGVAGLASSTLGAGASTLTVPILVYLFGMPVHDALATSLIVVVFTALSAVLFQYRIRLVNICVGLPFALAGIPGAIGGSWLSGAAPNDLLLLLYALLLLPVAGWTLLRSRRLPRPESALPIARQKTPRYGVGLWAAGCLAGVLTGFFGVGGGFLKVPLLMGVGRLPIHEAVGTSLFVILITAGVSLPLHLQFASPDWQVAALFAAGGMSGATAGSFIVTRISGATLQTTFGFALAAVALFMMLTI